jgi:8-oxo-dGTP pyrophosphatase MutT (NUDIX family)
MTKPAPVEIPYHGSFRPLDERSAIAGQGVAWLIRHLGKAAFERANVPGHVTGSGFVLSPDRRQTLLLHHRKLNRWLMPGGHCDGEMDAKSVAEREILEETGLQSVRLIQDSVFDADVHEIPARGDIPAHLHFDLRYLFEADPALPAPGNHESLALEWVPLQDLENYTDEPAMLVVRKAAKVG